MKKQSVLLICGTLNQTEMMHKIGVHLEDECRCCYTPYYCDGRFLQGLARKGILDFTPIGGKLLQVAKDYLGRQGLAIDYGGQQGDYDLILTCNDLIIQGNIQDKRIVLVQEGLTEPEGVWFHLVRRVGFPRWFASSSTFGLSNAYEIFCVASEGYRELFVNKGVPAEKIRVTGIPNFDDVASYKNNDFPHRDFVLVATSNARENFKFENRRKFLRKALEIADGRPIIFKLHPGEGHERAIREIRTLATDPVIYASGNIHEMIANCSTLVAQYSTVAFTAHALGKEVCSWVPKEQLERTVPLQNGGTSGERIAELCRSILRGDRPGGTTDKINDILANRTSQ